MLPDRLAMLPAAQKNLTFGRRATVRMKHTKYLRAGSLVCLLALCLGLLTACGGATLPLDKLYVDDARPGKPVTLNTATEVFREKGTLEEVYGNLALFITRNEDSSLLKEIVCNLASGKKLY